MSNSATKAKNKYNAKAYDRVGLMLPKGLGTEWKAEAERRNLSLNAFVIEAVKKYIEENSTNGDI